MRGRSSACRCWLPAEGVEEFAAGGVVEDFGVGVFGGGGGGVAEQFADDFEAQAAVDEVAGEGAAEGVGGDLGAVVAVDVACAAGVVPARVGWGAGAGGGSDVGAVGEPFHESPWALPGSTETGLVCSLFSI